MTAPAGTTVGNLLDESTALLATAGVPEPRREATTLVAHVLRTDRGGVQARKPDPLPEPIAASVRALVRHRAGRRPLQHLLGTVEFHGLEIEVGPDVLIPRPETEGLVDAVLEAGLPDDARVADLGTGSGCIAIALAVARPGFRITMLDRSAEALAVARHNAVRHGVAGRVDPIEADFSWLRGSPSAFHAIVSNPPYVPESEWRGLSPEVRDYEPRMALVPGPSGLEAYAAIAPHAHASLVPGGLLAVELGWKSEADIRRIVASAGFRKIRVLPDLAGIPRVMTARR